MSKITLSYLDEGREESTVISFPGDLHMDSLLAQYKQFITAIGYPIFFGDNLQLVAEDEIVIKVEKDGNSDNSDECLDPSDHDTSMCSVCNPDSPNSDDSDDSDYSSSQGITAKFVNEDIDFTGSDESDEGNGL